MLEVHCSKKKKKERLVVAFKATSEMVMGEEL
jgi:hypothetical protein